MFDGQDCEGISNSRNRSGSKRVIEEIDDGLEVKNEESSDFMCGNIGKRKIRVLETVGDKLRGFRGVGIDIEDKENEGIESRIMGAKELGILEEGKKILGGTVVCGSGEMEKEETENSDRVRELEKVGSSSGCDRIVNESIVTVDVVEEERKLEFDLNVPVLDAEFGGSEAGVREYTQVRPVIAERSVKVVDISSDESEDEGKKLVDVEDDTVKAKEIEKGQGNYESNISLDLDLGKIEVDQAAGESTLTSGVRRYTREEKGKAKLVSSWISLASNSMQLDLRPGEEELIESAVSGLIQLYETGQPRENTQLEEVDEFELRRERLRAIETLRRREAGEREAEDRLLTRRRLALPQEEDCYREPLGKEQKVPSVEIAIDSENFPNLFSTALNILRERNLKQCAQQLIKWMPLDDHDHDMLMPFVPSLLDLSLKVLANNADAIVSLEAVPDALKRRLSNLLCDSRKMNVHALDLFVRGSPTEIHIKDCSWITENQFTETFGSFDPRNLRVFQLDLCGQCMIDDIIAKTLARCSNRLPCLSIISLRGACRLSDDALKALIELAPALCSINLGQCSLLTHVGINVLANSLGSSLRELFIDYCNRIDARRIAPALRKFEHLEVLSVAGIQTVCDGFVNDIITACGRNMKDLDLADCQELTNFSLKVVGETCSELRALNIANLYKLTDLGLLYLANGCRSIQKLKLCRNGFSDEAIAAFLEVSGKSLNELSLNHVSKVGCSTAFSLAKCSRKLLSLDLSWCRRVTNEALGLIVDSCLSLKLLKLFGCTQITNVFLNGHSNSQVRIIGLNLTSVLEHVNILEAEEVLLRHSPLPISSESQSVDHQDV